MAYNFSDPLTILIFVILIITNLSEYLTSPSKLLGLVLSLPAILIGLTFHEYAHALAADKLGDDTPRRQGRLSLNPLRHIDPYGMILLLFAGFGWGKPVEINPANFNRKVTIRQGNAIVSLAGPLMNFLLAFIFSVIYGLLLRFSYSFLLYNNTGYVIKTLIESIITINVSLGIFNLIPLPPLDGSKILLAILPTKATDWVNRNQKILYFIFLIIWITPISGAIVAPAINAVNNGLLKLILAISGIR